MYEYQFYIFELVFRKNAEAFREYYNRIFQPPDMGVCGNELLDSCVEKADDTPLDGTVPLPCC